MNLGAVASGQEGGKSFGHKEEETITDRGFRFGRNGTKDRDDKAARIKKSVTYRVPQRCPDDGTCDGDFDRAHIGQGYVG